MFYMSVLLLIVIVSDVVALVNAVVWTEWLAHITKLLLSQAKHPRLCWFLRLRECRGRDHCFFFCVFFFKEAAFAFTGDKWLGNGPLHPIAEVLVW